MNDTKTPATGLYAELRRRRVFRTLALYILGAWGLMQVADVVLPGLGLPEESIRYLLIATVAGFPVAIVFAWFFDISDGGIRRTPAPADGDIPEPRPLQATDYLLLAALLAVLGLVGYGVVSTQPLLESGSSADATATPAGTGAPTSGPPMVGVLPFEHMGTGEDGEFFASGIHDDLLTRLAKIQGMRVISRTSVLGYAGTTKRIPEIGRELRADAILEGGVRIAGSQIRINAQLIDARSDEHLWAETYDRQLTAENIFEIQSEIARAIAAALQATLTEEDNAQLAMIPTSNMAAYRAFHEIMRWRDTVTLSMNSGNKERFLDGLRRAFELDPDYARPMLEYVGQLSLEVFFRKDRSVLPEIERMIERIGEVAPGSADYYAAQSFYMYYVMRDYDRAEALVQEAQKRAPSDPRMVMIQSYIQRRQGDFEGYLVSARKARDLDPQNERLQSVYIGRLMVMHRYDAAREEIERLDRLDELGQILRAQLVLAGHHEPERYLQDLEPILGDNQDWQKVQTLYTYWEAQLAARDFEGIERTAERIVARMQPWDPANGPAKLMPNDLSVRHGTALLTGQEARADEIMAEIKLAMGLEGLTPQEYPKDMHPKDRTIIAFEDGDLALAEALASNNWRDKSGDLATWSGTRHYDCQILGLIGSTAEAVACLRNVFTEPSAAMPFFEPHLPIYDPIRDTAAFRALWSELAQQGWVDPLPQE